MPFAIIMTEGAFQNPGPTLQIGWAGVSPEDPSPFPVIADKDRLDALCEAQACQYEVAAVVTEQWPETGMWKLPASNAKPGW